MHWIKLLAINLVVLVIFSLLGLACFESYLRVTIPASSGDSLFESTLNTRRYKLMKPNARIIAWGSEFRTNEMGFRDDDPLIPNKRPESFRIVVLGDSFTASAGVDYPKIYTSLLQRELSDAADVEVINLAVGGYNIIQYELVLDEVAMSLQPDLILTAVFPFNDLSNDTYLANYEDAMGLSNPSPKPVWYKNLYVYRAYLGRAEARIRRMLKQTAPVPSSEADPKALKGADEAEQNLAALRRIMEKAVAAGVPAVVALLPNTDDFQGQQHDFAPFVGLCAQQRWTCFDLLYMFAASDVDPRSLRLNVLDPHPNERYNDMVAGVLADSLRPLVAIRTSPLAP